VANFLLLEVEGETSPGTFGAYMLSRGIAVRDLGAMPGCRVGLYRIGIRNRAENERLVNEASRWRK
jgi:histidinol-phosphate/aromatic aminotransferase/cobyric acid decarboxylase-like protein